jgi:hypothetical protein
VLIGINVFPVVGGLYYWFPKITGRMLDERLGRWNFWTMFVGFNLGFFPMHLLGVMGMPRRVYTYPAGMGWDTDNLIVTAGALLFGLGVLLLLINVAASLRRGRPAGDNPWGAPTLEWATTSPPPPYNFPVIPTVASRHPLWEAALAEAEDRSRLDEGLLLDRGRETIATSPLDAEPNLILEMPADSLAPFVLALGLAAAFAGGAAHLWWLSVAGLALAAFSLAMWFWPRRVHEDEPATEAAHG